VSKLSADRALQLVGTELTAPPDRDHWRWLTSLQLQREQGTSFDTASTRLRLGRTQGGRSIDRNTYLQFDRARTTARGGSLTPAVTASALGAHFAWTRRDFDDLPFPAGGQGLAVELGGGLTLEQPRAPYARALVRWLGVWTPRRADAPDNARGAGGRLALRAEAGAVAARAAARVPATQLFLAGGDASVRGYALNSIGVTLPTGETAAGRYRAVGSVEWQQPLLRGGVPTDWEATVFLDAGAVADRVSELRGRVGVGFGVRWRSPVGPLQVDLARGQSTGQWRLHLNVGFSF
jgi:translocation and assembly module TamA